VPRRLTAMPSVMARSGSDSLVIALDIGKRSSASASRL